MSATVTIDGGRARVSFADFDLEAYEMFLRCKRLPHKELTCDREAGTYAVETEARFAHLLDEGLRPDAAGARALSPHLFDYQRFIVERALAAKRYAVWADTGLGKTAMFLEWARNVHATTGGRVVILSPLSIIGQTLEEYDNFYGNADQVQEPIRRLGTREELADFCRSGEGIAITNYEKLVPGVLPELSRLAGLVLDESSILKSGGGTIKWNLIKSARGIEYKVSCTATPAPNDIMEFASQAGFLERLRSEGEILWTYFSRDKRGVWNVKPHARDAFFAFMASWSVYLRDPARYGFEDILSSLPPPEQHEYRVNITEEQRAAADELLSSSGKGLFDTRLGVRERSKLTQIARGFLYEGTGKERTVRPIESRKPALVANLTTEDVDLSPVLVWTTFDEEARLVADEIRARAKDISLEVLDGSVPEDKREAILESFRHGDLDVLVTKAQLAGFGMNFQRCRSMVFSGFDDSYERMYQAVRRCYRFGQTETVRVHVPYVPELEGMVFENLAEKQRRFSESAEEMEQAYTAAMERQAA